MTIDVWIDAYCTALVALGSCVTNNWDQAGCVFHLQAIWDRADGCSNGVTSFDDQAHDALNTLYTSCTDPLHRQMACNTQGWGDFTAEPCATHSSTFESAAAWCP